MNKKLWVIFSLTVLVHSVVSAEQRTDRHLLVGAWKLTSWVIASPSGELSHPMGKSPEGRIIYTENGQMSAQLMYPDAILPNLSGLSESQVMGYVHSIFISYYGSYSVNESDQIVTHHVSGSNMPSMIGSDQIREFDLSDPNQIRLIARLEGNNAVENAGITGTNVLVWQRIQ
jgi:hypothetical protein